MLITQRHDKNSPGWRPDYWTDYLAPLWQRVCDVYAGLHTEDEKRRYLRQQLGEHDLVYDARIKTVAFENRLSPAVKSHAGLLSEFEFADDAPETLVEHQDNVDGQHNSIEAFLLDWDANALLYNASLCLVDVPVAETDADQRRDRRPRLVMIPLKDVGSPSVIMDEGMVKIERISVRRSVTIPDGLFGFTQRDLYWVYELLPLDPPVRVGGNLQRLGCAFSVWTQQDDGTYILSEEPRFLRDAANRILDSIPIVWYSPYGDPILFYGVDNNEERGGTPEYMPLVDLNIEYFNKHSELNTAESRGNYALYVYESPGAQPSGAPPSIIEPGRIAYVWGGSKLTILEPTGAAIQSTREGQRDRIKRMDAISQSFLTGGEAERTATEALIEATQSRLALVNIARRKESAVQSLCYYWELFSNPQFNPQEGEIGGIVVSESVLKMPPSPDLLRRYDDNFLNGQLTRPEWIAKMRQLGEYTEEMAMAAAMESQTPTLNLAFSGAPNNGISSNNATPDS